MVKLQTCSILRYFWNSAAISVGRMRAPSSIRANHEEAILAAAEAVFAERGFSGATTAEIAARAGLPKANLHYYFPTKVILYRRVLQGVLTAWLSAADAFASDAEPAEALGRYIAAKMDLARSRPQGSRIFASEILRGAPEIQDFLETTLRDWVESRGAIILGWVEAGRLRPIEPRTLFYMIWATTQHYADFAHQIATLNGGQSLDDAAFARARAEVVATLLGGVLVPDRAVLPSVGSSVHVRPAQGSSPSMRLSARNQIKGRIVEVTKGQTTSHIRIDVGGGTVVTASITNEAVDDLGLKVGQDAYAVIKASDVMVAVD